MKKIFKLFCCALPLLGLLCVVSPLHAQEQHDELQIVITSDKEKYAKGEIAEATIVATNQSEQTISNVEMECLVPDGLKLVEGSLSSTSVETLKAGEKWSMTVRVEAQQTTPSSQNPQTTPPSQTSSSPKTGDNTVFWSAALVIVALVMLGSAYVSRRKGRGIASQRLFSIFACTLLLTGMGILSRQAVVEASEGETISIQESKEISIDDVKYDLVFDIKYEQAQDVSSEGEDSSALELVDFLVEVESGREPVVLQLSDTQIIDASQERYADRLGSTGDTYWAPEKINERLYDSLTETIETTQPDLILLTGDLVYGEFDDNGTMFQSLVAKMESFGIPWAPVFGNHDNESAMGVDWQCEQFENAEHCLFKQRTLTGNGNYTVGIKQDGVLKRVFFMMDSNGCGSLHANSLVNGHTTSTVGFGQDQMDWSIGLAEDIQELSPVTKISFAFHIQIYAFKDAYAKYGFTNSNTINNPINIDKLDNKAEGDFGYIGRDLKGPWDASYTFYNRMKAVGVDSIFVGHEHCNSASVVYDGIRFQFGQKMGTYDRANFVRNDGTIYGASGDPGTPLSGGTVMVMANDGSFSNAYIYLSGDAQEKLDGAQEPPEDMNVSVNGLQVGTDMTGDSAVKSITSTTIAGENAWRVESSEQSKVYMDLSLLEGATRFTFSVYVPKESTTTMGLIPEYPLFSIRVKTTENSKPTFGLCNEGYVRYSLTNAREQCELMYDQWQTFTVDLTEMPSTCTEFAFNIGKNNLIYLKDVAFK